MAFLGCETQLRAVAMPNGEGCRLVRLGIDYASARPVFERRNRVQQQQLFSDIQVMERAALDAMSEMAE